VITFDGTGTVDQLGTVRIHGRATRGGGPITMTIDADDLKVGPELVERLAGYAPEAAVHLRRLSARVQLHAQVTLDPSSKSPPHYSVRAEVMGGEFAHARLPWPLEKLSGSISVGDGVVP